MFLNLYGENSHPTKPFAPNLLFFRRTVCPSEKFCMFTKCAIVRKQGPAQRRHIYHWISLTEGFPEYVRFFLNRVVVVFLSGQICLCFTENVLKPQITG